MEPGFSVYLKNAGFTKRVDYILAEWHIKKLSSNCRVYRGASIPFETNHRLLSLSCSFPSKSKQKLFFRKPTKPLKLYTNIKSLKDDPKICDNFSKTLDILLINEPSINDVNNVEKSFTESIRQASEAEIPKIKSSTKIYPWANDEFVNLLEQRRKCEDPNFSCKLNASIRKLRTKLKNDYRISSDKRPGRLFNFCDFRGEKMGEIS